MVESQGRLAIHAFHIVFGSLILMVAMAQIVVMARALCCSPGAGTERRGGGDIVQQQSPYPRQETAVPYPGQQHFVAY